MTEQISEARKNKIYELQAEVSHLSERLEAIREIVEPSSKWPGTDTFAELARAVVAVLDADDLAALSSPISGQGDPGRCSCGTAGPDEFGNFDQLEDPNCPVHGGER